MRRDPHCSRAKCHSPVPHAVVRPSCKRCSTDESLAVVKEDQLSDARSQPRSDGGPDPQECSVQCCYCRTTYTLDVESVFFDTSSRPSPGPFRPHSLLHRRCIGTPGSLQSTTLNNTLHLASNVRHIWHRGSLPERLVRVVWHDRGEVLGDVVPAGDPHVGERLDVLDEPGTCQHRDHDGLQRTDQR
jgi:hypothetical protein